MPPEPLNLPPTKTEIPKKGLTHAVCAFVEDLGREVSKFPDDAGHYPIKPKVVICWELQQTMADGRPFMLSKTFTFSSHRKASLMEWLNAWLDDPPTAKQVREGSFNMRSILGKCCTLTVTHYEKQDGTTGAKASAIAPPLEGKPELKVQNETPPPWIAKQAAENIAEVEKAERGKDGGALDEIPF